MLILIGAIFIQKVTAKTSAIHEYDSQLYKFPFNEKVISFKIESNYLESYLNKQKAKNDHLTVKVVVNNIKNKHQILVNGIENKTIKDIVEKNLFSKIYLFQNYMISEWLSGYIQVPQKDNFLKFEDPTQFREVSEIYIRTSKTRLMIIENLSTERVITRYEYIKPKWANGRLVLDTVRKEIADGNQVTRSISNILYGEVDGLGQAPIALNIKTEQMVYADQGNQVLRKINEEYQFKEFKVKN